MVLIRPLTRNLTKNLVQDLTNPFSVKPLELPVTAGLWVHYAAFQDGKIKSELVTVDGGDNVSAWLDQSPNGFDLAQATSSLQPQYTSAGVGMNGHPSLVLDGVDDFMRNDSVAPVSNSAHTVFFVARLENKSPAEFDAVYAFNTAGFDNHYLIMIASSPLGNLIQFDTDLETIVPDNVGDQFNIISLTFDTANTSCWRNGDFEATVVDAFFDTGTIFVLGADFDSPGTIGDWIQGQFGEFIIYDRVVTTAERMQIESYLSVKWGIPLV